jgi:hypothetical protein
LLGGGHRHIMPISLRTMYGGPILMRNLVDFTHSKDWDISLYIALIHAV